MARIWNLLCYVKQPGKLQSGNLTFGLDWVHPRSANLHRRKLSIFQVVFNPRLTLLYCDMLNCYSDICRIYIRIYQHDFFDGFSSEMVWLLERNTRGDIRARGLVTDMHFTEHTGFTRKSILSWENEKGGIPWIPEHYVLKIVQWVTITYVRSIAKNLTVSNEVCRISHVFGFTPHYPRKAKAMNWEKTTAMKIFLIGGNLSTNSSQYFVHGKGCIYTSCY